MIQTKPKPRKLLIGIDPDVTKSGVAFKTETGIELANLTFFELFDRLSFYKERVEKPTVYIECGFMNKPNFQKSHVANISAFGKICNNTGANHEVSKKIIEMCKYLDLPYVEVRPTRSKTDAKFFEQITGIKGRTNQETRDAYLLIHGR